MKPSTRPIWVSLHLLHCFPGDARALKGATYLHFVESPATERDPTPHAEEPDDLNNPHDVPGSAVRKQTLDLVMLLEHAQSMGTYYLFMEDDFRYVVVCYWFVVLVCDCCAGAS